MTTQAKYGLSAAILALAAVGLALVLIATPQKGDAQNMAAYGAATGSGRVAALPAPAVRQESPAMKEENYDPAFGWTEFSAGLDANFRPAAAKPYAGNEISTELEVE